jgi:hypothetical protein
MNSDHQTNPNEIPIRFSHPAFSEHPLRPVFTTHQILSNSEIYMPQPHFMPVKHNES